MLQARASQYSTSTAWTDEGNRDSVQVGVLEKEKNGWRSANLLVTTNGFSLVVVDRRSMTECVKRRKR